MDLRTILRDGGTREDLADAMARCVALKPVVHGNHGNIQMSRIGG